MITSEFYGLLFLHVIAPFCDKLGDAAFLQVAYLLQLKGILWFLLDFNCPKCGGPWCWLPFYFLCSHGCFSLLGMTLINKDEVVCIAVLCAGASWLLLTCSSIKIFFENDL